MGAGVRQLGGSGLLIGWILASCMLPPEGSEQAPYYNSPPRADLQSMRPYAPITAIPVDRCPVFRVELGRVVDLDNAQLRFRWVANNRSPRVRWLRDFDLVSEAPPGEAHRAFARVVPGVDFPAEVEQAKSNHPTSGVLSLFITDAPAWLEPQPETPSAEAQDLGQLPPSPTDAPLPYSVVELRWTFRFGEEGDCP